MKKKILLGTTNPSKIKRFESLLDGHGFEFCTPIELGITGEPDECGHTPEENAKIKAEFYGRFFDPVICNDSGLYLAELDRSDARQPGLHVRSPRGERMDDEQLIVYYSELVRSLGGRALAYYEDGIAVFSRGKVYGFTETPEISRRSSFWLVDKIAPKRNAGWPLDSISIDVGTGEYFVDAPNIVTDSILIGEYKEHIVEFVLNSLL